MKTTIDSASKGLNSFAFNPVSVLSLDLGDFQPALCLEVLKGSRYNSVKGNGIVRLAPQSFPPFGKLYLNNATFFVPFYQLTEQANAIQDKMTVYKGNPVVVPHISARSINYIFTTSSVYSTAVATSVSDPTSSSAPAENTYDFINIGNNSGTKYNYYKLTAEGRARFKVLKALGYDFVSFGYNSTYNTASASGEYDLSAMPLLAYAKVFTDMFMNEHAYNRSALVHLLHAIHDCKDYVDPNLGTMYTASTGNLSAIGLNFILDNIHVPHHSDFFTTAYGSPNSPFNGVNANDSASINSRGLVSPYEYQSTPQNDNIVSDVNGNILRNGNGTNPLNNLSALGQRMLIAWDKFARRYNLTSKAAMRVYNTFGVKPEDLLTQYVHKVSESSQRIDFYPVMSQTDSINGNNGKALGAYAGAGVASFNVDYSYQASDNGYLITLFWLQIHPIVMRGKTASVLRVNPWDFYQPEFDGQTVRPIPLCELSTNKNSKVATGTDMQDKSVFGFVNYGDDYRTVRDVVAGDFVLDENTRNFLFARDYSYFRDKTPYVIKAQDVDVLYYDHQDNADMTDPFITNRSNGDRFYLMMDFDINCQLPVLSRADSLNLDGAGEISINNGGVQSN